MFLFIYLFLLQIDMFLLKFLVHSNRFLCIVINNEESPHLTTSHDNELLLCIFNLNSFMNCFTWCSATHAFQSMIVLYASV